MPSKTKVKLNESPETDLNWTDDEVQLLLKSIRNFKTQKICGSATLFDSTTPSFFLEHIFSFSLPNAKLFPCCSQVSDVFGI